MYDYIEIEGVKYKVDPNDKTKPLLDDKGEKILYVEPDDKNKNKIDLSKVSIDDIKKANPELARILQEAEDNKSKLSQLDREKEEADRKTKEEAGKWQDIATDETNKRKDAEGKLSEVNSVLEKYKGTVNGILEATIQTIPEDKRGLIPKDYSPRKKLEYINANAKTLGITIGVGKGGAIPPHEVDINLDEESKLQKEFDELSAKKDSRTPEESARMLALAKKIKEVRIANANAKK